LDALWNLMFAGMHFCIIRPIYFMLFECIITTYKVELSIA